MSFCKLNWYQEQKPIVCRSVVRVHDDFVYVLGNSLQVRFRIELEEIAK